MINDCLPAIKIMSNDTFNWMILDFEEYFVGSWANQPAGSIYWFIWLYTTSRAGVELSMIHWIWDRHCFFTSFDWLIRSWFCWTSFYRFETFIFFPFRQCELRIPSGLSTNINIRSHTHTNRLRVLHQMKRDARTREARGDSLPGIKMP